MREETTFVIDMLNRKKTREWIQYSNGNYFVEINSKNGTKIRTTFEDEFCAQFPENIDIKITDYCDMNCPMCHEGSSKEGPHADLKRLISDCNSFIHTLREGTELAIGGGKVTSHPDLAKLLLYLKRIGVFANITVHMNELKSDLARLQAMIHTGLIKGLGISMSAYDEGVVQFAQKNPNCVIHLIAGYTSLELLENLANKGLKILVLGYKDFRRGADHMFANKESIESSIKEWTNKLKEILPSFKVVSFDNLSIKQMRVKEWVSEDQWGMFYMGNDSEHTMYIDLVKKKYASHSTASLGKRYDLESSIDSMFEKIRGSVKE